MEAYSQDLRERVVAACDEGVLGRREVAEQFAVSTAWIRRLLQRRRETGSIAALPHGKGRPPILNAADRERLRECVRRHADWTLGELVTKIKKTVSVPTLCRVLQALRLPRKKKTLRAAEQDRPDVQCARRRFRRDVKPLDCKRFLFIDESCTTTTMLRSHGRAEPGQRVIDAVPYGHWRVVTVISAIGWDGVPTAMLYPGAVNGLVFDTFVEQLLVPILRSGDLVMMDNLSSHKVAGIAELIRGAGAELRYLPPYSPDFNPIEKMFAKLKAYLRRLAARTQRALYDALADGLRTITATDCAGFFRSCNYIATSN